MCLGLGDVSAGSLSVRADLDQQGSSLLNFVIKSLYSFDEGGVRVASTLTAPVCPLRGGLVTPAEERGKRGPSHTHKGSQ